MRLRITDCPAGAGHTRVPTDYILKTPLLTEAGGIGSQVMNQAQAESLGLGSSSVGSAVNPLVITAQPQSVTVDEPDGAIFIITAIGGVAPLQYQWYRNGSPISGANTNQLTLVNSYNQLGDIDDGAVFTCRVTDGVTELTSQPAVLSVVSLVPLITSQPSSASTTEGQSAAFSIAVNCNTPHYQWKKNGVNVGTDSPNLLLTNLVYPDDNAASITCVVTNVNGTATSDAVTLTVTASLPVITQQPADVNIMEPTSAQFSCAVTSGTAVSYQWYRNSTPILNATSASYSLTTTNHALDDGATFQCAITNAGGTVLTRVAALAVAPDSLRVTAGPSFSVAMPMDAGLETTLQLTAAGGGSITYEWFRNGVSMGAPSTSSSRPLGVVPLAWNSDEFYCVLRNGTETVTSGTITLQVVAGLPVIPTMFADIGPFEDYYFDGTLASPQSLEVLLVVYSETQPTVQWFKDEVLINSPRAVSEVFAHGGYPAGFNYWYVRLTLSEISAHTVAQSVGVDGNPTWTFDYNDNGTYRCAITNPQGTVSSQGNVLVGAGLPYIATWPSSASGLQVNDLANFSLSVISSAPVQYYNWYLEKSGQPAELVGSGYPYLSLPVTADMDGAVVYCEITTERGMVSTQSSPATIGLAAGGGGGMFTHTYDGRLVSGAGPLRAVAYGNGVLVAGLDNANYGPLFLTSADNGSSWSAGYDGFGYAGCRKLAFQDGKFFALCFTGASMSILTSTDGSTWSVLPNLPAGSYMSWQLDVAFDGLTGMLGATETGLFEHSLDNGVTAWNYLGDNRPTPIPTFDSVHMLHYASLTDRFVFVGNTSGQTRAAVSGQVHNTWGAAWSDNVNDWTLSALTNFGGVLSVVEHDGQMLMSSDGYLYSCNLGGDLSVWQSTHIYGLGFLFHNGGDGKLYGFHSGDNTVQSNTVFVAESSGSLQGMTDDSATFDNGAAVGNPFHGVAACMAANGRMVVVGRYVDMYDTHWGAILIKDMPAA